MEKFKYIVYIRDNETNEIVKYEDTWKYRGGVSALVYQWEDGNFSSDYNRMLHFGGFEECEDGGEGKYSIKIEVDNEIIYSEFSEKKVIDLEPGDNIKMIEDKLASKMSEAVENLCEVYRMIDADEPMTPEYHLEADKLPNILDLLTAVMVDKYREINKGKK